MYKKIIRTTMFIVNLTTKSFFRYNPDKGYIGLLSDLITPPNKDTKYSHWSKQDHIVFCPIHLQKYVEKTYSELYF